MISQNPPLEIYDPKTLAVMDKAFHAIWHVLRTNDPFRDYANDSELRIAIGRRLMELVASSHDTNRRFPRWRSSALATIQRESEPTGFSIKIPTEQLHP
jgi:hypothetical protein